MNPNHCHGILELVNEVLQHLNDFFTDMSIKEILKDKQMNAMGS